MQLAPKRNATTIRNKNGPRRIYSWNVFLICANQVLPRFLLRFLIIRPFFTFLRSTRWNLRQLEFGKVVSKEPRGTTGTRYGETERNIFYFRGLRTKYILRMHGGTEKEQPTGKLLSLRGAFQHGVSRLLGRTSNRVEDHWKLVAVSQACERPFR